MPAVRDNPFSGVQLSALAYKMEEVRLTARTAYSHSPYVHTVRIDPFDFFCFTLLQSLQFCFKFLVLLLFIISIIIHFYFLSLLAVYNLFNLMCF